MRTHAVTDEQIAARRADILEHASQLIGSLGVDGCSLALVGRSAGVSIGMIQHHFATRDNLIRESIAYRGRVSAGVWQRIAAETSDPIVRLRALLDFAVDGERPFEAAWGFWLEVYAAAHRNPDIRLAVGESLLSWRDAFITCVSQARDAGLVGRAVDPIEAGSTIVAFADGLAVQVLSGLYDTEPDSMRRSLYTFAATQLGLDAGDFADRTHGLPMHRD